MKKPEKEVLIVGAGPTGLVLGLILDKLDVPFHIIDEKSGPGSSSRAMLMVPGTLDHYHQLELISEVVRAGIEMKEIKINTSTREKTVDLESFGKNMARFPCLLTYPQDEHEALLVNKLESLGHQISWNTTFQSLQQNDTNVQVVIKTKDQKISRSYTYLAGCDGGSSDVRKSLQIDFKGKTNNKLFYVADVKIAKTSDDLHQANMFLSGRDFSLLFPLRNQETHRLIGMVPAYLSKKDKTAEGYVLPYMEKKFGLEIESCNWFSEYKIHHRIAGAYKKGNVFLAGDAAHLHSPVGGQGMNAGIGDAVNLGWKLAHVINGRLRKEALQSYEQERKGFARSLVATTDRLFKFISSDHKSVAVLREAFFPDIAGLALKNGSRLGDRVFKLASQAGITYKESVLHSSSSGSNLIGSKLPYTGRNCSTIDDIKWHLQVYGRVEDRFRQFCEEKQLPLSLVEWKPEMKKTGLTQNTAYFIRPDGYIAWTSENQSPDSLHSYLKTWNIKL